MPSDTPTPAEIVAAHLSYPWAGGSGCSCGEEFANARDHGAHVIAALSEHYHLLPKAEPTDTYDHCREEPMIGWEIEQGPHFVRVLDDEVQLEYDGEPEEPISPEAARYFASALASAADVAEEQR
ncbi:hypothetical protein SEA_KUWABARA_77 [Gordonia phage Kuwabara]|nr:hypothetical protein SEA_KUWABARA_77 [Gordonia phage Kuwabara]